MAAVRIEGEAFVDNRYDRLAKVAGLSDADHARGKMIRIWHQCTIENRYVLPEIDIEIVLGENGVRGLLESSLGERVDGGIRISGTRGRIEWLEKKRREGKKHGKKGAKFGALGGRPKRVNVKPGDRVSDNGVDNPPLAPALAPSGISDLSKRAHEVKSTGIARRVWTAYLKAFNASRPTGVPEMGDRPGAPGERAIADLLPGLMAEYSNDENRVESVLMHALAVAHAEAARGGSTQWLDENMWKPHRFASLRVRQVAGDAPRKAGKPDEHRREIRTLVSAK